MAAGLPRGTDAPRRAQQSRQGPHARHPSMAPTLEHRRTGRPRDLRNRDGHPRKARRPGPDIGVLSNVAFVGTAVLSFGIWSGAEGFHLPFHGGMTDLGRWRVTSSPRLRCSSPQQGRRGASTPGCVHGWVGSAGSPPRRRADPRRRRTSSSARPQPLITASWSVIRRLDRLRTRLADVAFAPPGRPARPI